MAFPKLKKFASEKGWEIVKNSAYGEENGYLFTLIDGAGTKTFATPLPQISDEDKEKVLDYLKRSKKQLKISEYAFDNKVLLIVFKENFVSTKVEVMNRMLDKLTEYLEGLGIRGKGCCIFCEKDGAAETIYIDGIIYSAHDECYNSELNAMDEVVREYETEEKNYLFGLLGALMGGILGSVPWILVQVFLNRIVAVLAIVIGLGALKGYGILKGRMGPLTRWIILFSTIVSVVLAQYAGLAIELIRNDIPVSYGNFVIAFSIPEVVDSFRANLIMSLILALLGIAGMFFGMKGDSKSVLPTLNKKDE